MILNNLRGNVDEVINMLKIVPSNLEPKNESVLEYFEEEEEKKEEIQEDRLEFVYPSNLRM